MKIAIFYALFAAVAAVANIVAQELFAQVCGQGHLLASIVVGTGVGLAVKYVLDKRYVFRYRTRSIGHDGRTFVLYTTMGLATTAIFWGFEFSFHAWFDGAREMRYLGGIIGLALGYWVKYHLDKHYVFKKAVP